MMTVVDLEERFGFFFLSQEGTVKSRQKISSLEGGFNGELNEDDNFGGAVAAIGDLDFRWHIRTGSRGQTG